MFNKIYENIKKFIKNNYKGLIVLLVVYLVFTIELPFQIYSPGGAVNLNDRITISSEYEVNGSFNMAYVSVVRASLPFMLISKVIPDWDLVKKDNITLEGEDLEEMFKREKLDLQESMDNAIINAYKEANKTITIKKIKPTISYITTEAKTNLKIGDEIIDVEGKKIESLDDLKKIITSKNINDTISLKVLRDNKEKTVTASIYKEKEGLKIGVSIITLYEYDTNPEVSIKSKSSEAGASGGLMMSLTIYNKLVKEDITKGKKIVGTGTIDKDGNVGEIGGVKYKIMGAVKNKAEVFICPEENYEEALSVVKEKKYNIKIINVKTFKEALEKLKNI